MSDPLHGIEIVEVGRLKGATSQNKNRKDEEQE
jgi:hypothetical protein